MTLSASASAAASGLVPYRNIAVIGIGSMGGGMARALMDANVSQTVTAYDHATALVQSFFDDSQAAGKAATPQAPTSLTEAIVGHDASSKLETDLVVLVLQNAAQCQEVCFGTETDNAATKQNCLSHLLSAGACVLVCSTVPAVWIQQAATRLTNSAGIHVVDCPVSGGPVRARKGTLSLMVSGDDGPVQLVQPALEALGNQHEQPPSTSTIHRISGGVGMGSTVKMVHQLLAAIHVVTAAEALSLAAKAGLNVSQLYEIVTGAAGNSWMFQDRATRMMMESPENKSFLQIMVKDLNIVHSEAQRLQSPIPLASTALQQFASAMSLGLAKHDDSQVVQVYERISGAKVAAHAEATTTTTALASDTNTKNEKKEGTNVGDYWKMEDGSLEEIVEVGMEPRHNLVLSNPYVRALRVSFPPNDTTLAHRHDRDSLYFFLVPGQLNVLNHVQGREAACDCMGFGEVRFGAHASDGQPLVHKITNQSNQTMLCIDAELVAPPPLTCPVPLIAEHHTLIKTRPKCRVYQLKLDPHESVTVSYPFFHCTVVVEGGMVKRQSMVTPQVQWTETLERGDVAWHEPTAVVQRQTTNVGTTTVIVYIAEWC